jgi:hypothetical protein
MQVGGLTGVVTPLNTLPVFCTGAGHDAGSLIPVEPGTPSKVVLVTVNALVTPAMSPSSP